MDALMDLHAAQPFWIWLALGVLLLAVEAAFSTEWLLWPAVSAGAVAVVTALGLPLGGFWGEAALFAVLTVIATLLSRRLVQRVNPADAPDINARDGRLVGQRAQVTEAFVDGRGRVFVSGAEWAAEIDGVAPPVGESVIVAAVDGARLKVRAA
ncbi:MAG: NfeD family protein [Brevundimonas sp.]|jgi:membrane protein implicated in regulation of membrane protease activity|uniref:NfeD family protein n=1 Tax=Brevundimonas sp. TaxID=1871086 RepID=UPI001803D5D9|nr:NfeD family protein [Brevundimonas sp.]MBA4804017.1 NfeD family protein [Brevundimonas sp.]